MIEKVHHHKHRPIREHKRPIPVFGMMYRLLFPVMGVLSLLVIGTGLATLAKGRLGYYNYRHLVVFAPFAVVIGILFVVATFARWRRSKSNAPKPSQVSIRD
jgi:hypothetical protein